MYLASFHPKTIILFKSLLQRRNIHTHCYTSITIYCFLDAILKSYVLQESVNKLYFVNKQVKLLQNHHFCIKYQKVAIIVLHSVVYSVKSKFLIFLNIIMFFVFKMSESISVIVKVNF